MKARTLHKIQYKLKKAAPIIFSIAASAGVVTTTVVAIKDTPKALVLIEKRRSEQDELSKIDVVKAAWKCYVPTAILGLSTVFCISASTFMSMKNQAAITSAYIAVSKAYRDYRNKVKELYGEETHQEIVKSLAAEKVSSEHCIYSPSIGRSISTTFDGSEEEIKTFYDVLSGHYFESTIGKVMAAEYAFNRNFNLRGMYADIDDFYKLLGISVPHDPRVIGWDCDEELTWIDFHNYVGTIEDGMQIHYIEMIPEPHLPEYYESDFA